MSEFFQPSCSKPSEKDSKPRKVNKPKKNKKALRVKNFNTDDFEHDYDQTSLRSDRSKISKNPSVVSTHLTVDGLPQRKDSNISLR